MKLSKNPLVILLVGLVVLVVVWGSIGALRGLLRAPSEPVGGTYGYLIIDATGGARYMKSSPGFPGKAFPRADEFQPTPGAVTPTLVTEQVLGTIGNIRIWDPDDAVNRVAAEFAFQRIKEIGSELSLYDADSELWEVNNAAGKEAVQVGDSLLRVLKRALVLAELSDGAFDPTVGPLVLLWRETLRNGVLPTQEQIDRQRALVNYRNVEVDEVARTVRLTKPGMILDLGGIAKGYIADEAAKALQEEGVQTATVELGGDIAAFGTKPNGSSFRILIENPFTRQGTPQGLVEGTDFAVVTSGNYQKYVIIRGMRFSHLIDPRTGKSTSGLASCTVTGPDAMTCDALATAICVVGSKEAPRLTEKLNEWFKAHGK